MNAIIKQWCLLMVLTPSAAHVYGESLGKHHSDEVVSQLHETLKWYDSIDVRAKVTTTYKSDLRSTTNRPTVEETVLHIRRQGTRALLSKKRKSGEEGVLAMQNDVILYDNGDVLRCQAALDTSLQQVEGITDDLGLLLYSKRLAGKQSKDSTSMYHGLNDAGVILWIVGYAPLMEYIRSASDVAVSLSDDTAELQATSEYGQAMLSLSKLHAWLPKSFNIVKKASHKYKGKLVNAIDMAGGGIWPAGGVKEITWTGSVLSFEENAERPFPKYMTVVKKYHTEAGVTVVVTTDIDILQLTYEPILQESDFQTDIVAPTGYQVSVHEAPHLPYRWNGKEAVPGVPDLPDRNITPVDLAATDSNKRAVLIVLNTALVALLAVLLWKKRRAT